MGLHDRLSKQQAAQNGNATLLLEPGQASEHVEIREADPYGELKTRIHHACIAKLGPELFKRDPGEDLTERVLRTVTEELTLDRTPLTREERRELVRQLTDDILGYGPLEQLLRDDSVTEIMVNAYDRVYIERNGKIELSESRFVRPTFELARLSTKRMWFVGKDSSSSVCRASLTFFSVGTSRPHRTSNSSVRSRVASIGPWKNGEVSTTITS